MFGRLFVSSVRATSRGSLSLRPLVTPCLSSPRFYTTPSNPPPASPSPAAPVPPTPTPTPTATPPTPSPAAAPTPKPTPTPSAPSTPSTPTTPTAAAPPGAPAAGAAPGVAPGAAPGAPTELPPPPLFENVIAERRGKVGLVRLNRPKQLNALSDALVKDIYNALLYFQDDKEVGAIILTGSEKAFAAGADIREMGKKEYMETYKTDMLAQWQDIQYIKKPIIAAVNGFALGGGCELAMLCDIIIAGETAMFGQPEVKLGTIPGCGGTQRLIRAIGKSKAMELILTGNQMTAQEAEKAGLVSRVVPPEKLLDEALRIAGKISSFSQPIIAMAKESVNASYELSLQQGLHFERRMFHSTFATKDQKEGMGAFIEKRDPQWTNE